MEEADKRISAGSLQLPYGLSQSTTPRQSATSPDTPTEEPAPPTRHEDERVAREVAVTRHHSGEIRAGNSDKRVSTGSKRLSTGSLQLPHSPSLRLPTAQLSAVQSVSHAPPDSVAGTQPTTHDEDTPWFPEDERSLRISPPVGSLQLPSSRPTREAIYEDALRETAPSERPDFAPASSTIQEETITYQPTPVDEFSEKVPPEEEDNSVPDPDIRVEKPTEDSQANTEVASDQEGLEKEAEDKIGPDPKRASYLSADYDTEGRRKRESIESRLSSAHRDSSVLSSSDVISFSDGATTPEPERPQHSRGTTTASGISTGSRRSMPPLRRKETKLAQKEAHPMQHLGITLGLPAIILFDLVVPIIIYYSWYNHHKANWRRDCREQFPNQSCPIKPPNYERHIMGYAIISFGFGELWILIARVWRLFFRREECAPLLSRSRWELDATSWVYGVAMILALIPFIVGAELEIPELYLYSPSFIMGFLGILMVITTLCPFRIPIGINSHARGTGLRPFIYYAAEDFIAVDGLQDREFRRRYNERYETNKMFRRFFLNLTLWWILGVLIYIGSVSAVIWTVQFHTAFGLSLGVLFSYIVIWAVVSYVWVRIEMRREHRAYEEGEVEA